jgi:gamma-glutamyltranspeptidase/glutathione hydrolase
MVIAQGGMVATSQPLAAQAGLQILRQGGNAADAAIATAAVLAVVEAASTGIGGDCFALYYNATTGTLTGLNGSGRAPAALTLDLLHRQGFQTMPERHPLAVTVPGAVHGWEALLTRHGKFSLAQVLEAAIGYATEGFPVSPIYARAWGRAEALLQANPSAREYWPDGHAPRPGQVVRLPALARSLESIAQGGAEAFYTGDIAQQIVKTVQNLGGVLALDDLKAHQSSWVEPIHTTYRGVQVYEIPPNGQGLAALMALNIAEGFALGEWAWDDPARLHHMIEAMRLAFADANRYIADPDFAQVPVAGLLSPAYAAQRRALIQPQAVIQPLSYGIPSAHSDTVYLSVVDGAGNACSFINSLYMGFGSGIVADGTGIFLQNRGANFSLAAGHPNQVMPRKRPYHTIIPGMALREGRLWASFGVMGGFMQPQGHFQVMSALLDDGLDPQVALDRLRWMVDGESGSGVIALEGGINPKTVNALQQLGHQVQVIQGDGRAVFGCGQVILRDSNGVLYGGSDPRKDGQVAAF